MTKLALSLSALALFAGVSAASANGGAPHVNGRDIDQEKQITATEPNYAPTYQSGATAMDPAAMSSRQDADMPVYH